MTPHTPGGFLPTGTVHKESAARPGSAFFFLFYRDAS